MAYLLLLLSSFLAATILPFSSEAHLLLLLNERYQWEYVLLAATVGNSLGAALTFYLGWWCKWDWIERYLKIKKEKVSNYQERINKYAYWLAFLGWMPIIGDVIIVALGVFKISAWRCITLAILGKFLRYFVLTLPFIP